MWPTAHRAEASLCSSMCANTRDSCQRAESTTGSADADAPGTGAESKVEETLVRASEAVTDLFSFF